MSYENILSSKVCSRSRHKQEFEGHEEASTLRWNTAETIFEDD